MSQEVAQVCKLVNKQQFVVGGYKVINYKQAEVEASLAKQAKTTMKTFS